MKELRIWFFDDPLPLSLFCLKFFFFEKKVVSLQNINTDQEV